MVTSKRSSGEDSPRRKLLADEECRQIKHEDALNEPEWYRALLAVFLHFIW